MPDGKIVKVWSKGVIKKIVPLEKIVTSDYFSNEKGEKIKPEKSGMDPNFPDELEVTITFEDAGEGKTKLTLVYPKPESEAAVKAMMESGMKEGWSSSLDKLEAIL